MFQIFVPKQFKIYVTFVTLSINNNIKFLENIKQGFKRTLFWNTYRSEIITKPKTNNLNYQTDPTLKKNNRLFVLSLKNGNYDPIRYSFDKFTSHYQKLKNLMHKLAINYFLISQSKTNKKRIKNLLKFQEMLTMQQEIY